jgi:TolB-like protein
MRTLRLTAAAMGALAAAASLSIFAQQQQPPAVPPPQQPTEVTVPIIGPGGLPPKLAIAPFIAVSSDAETVAAAKTITDVLFDDLEFEREFYMIGKDVTATVPKLTSLDDLQMYRWRELNANGLVVGSVAKTANGAIVRVKVIEVNSGQMSLGKEYSGSIANPRLYAHTISDEIHQQLRGLKGVARTKLAFTSDRDAERMKGPQGDREIKEIYLVDYDGAGPKRVTVSRTLNVAPV